MNTEIDTILDLLTEYMNLPEKLWTIQSKKNVTVDKRKAVLLRFVKSKNQHLYGEHFSSLLSQEGNLLGYVLLNISHNNSLVNKDNAEISCIKFLKKFGQDLLENQKILWIKPHNEILKIDDQSILIKGMKVKSLDQRTGLYFWTIVDGDGKVYVFERDIQWLDLSGKRGTEKWLHDEWLDTINH